MLSWIILIDWGTTTRTGHIAKKNVFDATYPLSLYMLFTTSCLHCLLVWLCNGVEYLWLSMMLVFHSFPMAMKTALWNVSYQQFNTFISRRYTHLTWCKLPSISCNIMCKIAHTQTHTHHACTHTYAHTHTCMHAHTRARTHTHTILFIQVLQDQGFMQDQIIASHTCFGGHLDVNCLIVKAVYKL